MENRDLPNQHAPLEAPPKDEYAQYEQLSKKIKQQSKVCHDYEKIKAPTPAKNKAKRKHCEIVLGDNSIHGTSHLKGHLDKCPKKVHHDIK